MFARRPKIVGFTLLNADPHVPSSYYQHGDFDLILT